MKLDERAHLTYCSNIHPAESWAEVFAALRAHVPLIRSALRHDGPFGLGLRLSAQAARSLCAPETIEAFEAWMDANDAYVFTLNGFPYGPFHGTSVKEAVYRPDWSRPERLDYTLDLIDVLARLLPTGVGGSISTVPGAFRHDPAAASPQRVAALLVDAAAHCWQHAQRTGVDIALGLEPEPMCMLETTDEAIAFLTEHVFGSEARARFSRATGCSPPAAEEALRRHLGLCYDTCHAAVEFEDALRGPARLREAGIRLTKVQVTAGLEIERATPEALERLEAFADDTYLHQVVVEADDGLVRLLDLPEALARARAGALPSGRWRVHLHVPVFAALDPPIRSTSAFIRAALPQLRDQCAHFEVETYTWSVLPSSLRTRSPSESIAGELRWTERTWYR